MFQEGYLIDLFDFTISLWAEYHTLFYAVIKLNLRDA